MLLVKWDTKGLIEQGECEQVTAGQSIQLMSCLGLGGA